MRKLFFLVIVMLSFTKIHSQVGIGTTSPDDSAILDLTSNNRGFLPPRINLASPTDITTIPSPAVGLSVYHTGNPNFESGYYYFNGSIWSKFVTVNATSGSSIKKQRLIAADPANVLNSANDIFSFRYSTAAVNGKWQIRYNGPSTRDISVFTIENWVPSGYSAQTSTSTLNSGVWIDIPGSTNVGTVNELNTFRIYDLADGTILQMQGMLINSNGVKESMILEQF